MVSGVQFGWETLNLKNAGDDYYIGPTVNAIPVHYLQIKASLAGSLGTYVNGFSQVLHMGWFSQKAPTFSGAGTDSFNTPTNTDWGTQGTSNPNGFAVGAQQPSGSPANSNTLYFPIFSNIMKTEFPNTKEWSEVIYFPDGFILPAGSYFVMHADHTDAAGVTNIAADFEVQGIICYG